MWEKGRQLKSYDGITYTYNANGIRTSKTIGNVKHTYILDGTRVLKEGFGKQFLNAFKYVFKNCKKITRRFIVSYCVPNIRIAAAQRITAFLIV